MSTEKSQEETETHEDPPVLASGKGAMKRKSKADNKKLWESSWESSLDGEELQLLEELGLGVGVDITVKHPWARKSAFQAKRVAVSLDEELEAVKVAEGKDASTVELEATKQTLVAKAKASLIVINESNQFLKTNEHVETYSAVQASLESSFRPDPSKPISVNITADFHRSNTRSKTIKGSTVLTRTVAFRMQHPSSRKEGKEMFENQLHQWLVNHDDDHKHNEQSEKCVFSPKTNHYCIKYLKELGGVTHYVSSVTLGATKYQISQNSTLFNSLSTSSGGGVDSFVSASTKSKVSKRVFQSSSKEQQIGKVPHHDSDLKELLKFRTKGEAVVRCSYNSLSNLVSHPELHKQLELGIQEYIDKQKNGTRGPYYIGTAKFMKVDEELKKRFYWRVDPDNYDIKTTSDISKASNFYIKPFVRNIGGEKYFHIVTDPEDVPTGQKTDPSTVETSHDTELQEVLDDTSNNIQESEERYEPKRYVTVEKGPPESLCADFVIKKKKRNTAFKLKNLVDDVTYPLSRSQWLPESSLGSQPYVICREGQSFHWGMKTVYLDKDKDQVTYTEKNREEKNYDSRLFILEHGRVT